MRHVPGLLALIETPDDPRLPVAVSAALAPMVAQLRSLEASIADFDRQILVRHRADATSRRLATIPGIGPVTASASAASITDVSMFASSRDFAAFLGLVPKQSSSGGKERLGRISKMGDRYLRKLLVVGATAVLRYAKADGSASKA